MRPCGWLFGAEGRQSSQIALLPFGERVDWHEARAGRLVARFSAMDPIATKMGNHILRDWDSQLASTVELVGLTALQIKIPPIGDMRADQGPKQAPVVRNAQMDEFMDSLERKFRSNPYENTRLFGANTARSSVYQRLELLAQHDQMVGHAWAALREAFYGEHAKSLLVIDYDLLAKAPHKVIELVYQFIGEPLFAHDFESLEYDAPDFDAQLGVPGLHKIRPKVELLERRTIIPPDLFDKYSQMTFWSDPSGSAANVIAPKPASKDNAS